jgi:hypothetical protein
VPHAGWLWLSMDAQENRSACTATAAAQPAVAAHGVRSRISPIIALPLLSVHLVSPENQLHSDTPARRMHVIVSHSPSHLWNGERDGRMSVFSESCSASASAKATSRRSYLASIAFETGEEEMVRGLRASHNAHRSTFSCFQQKQSTKLAFIVQSPSSCNVDSDARCPGGLIQSKSKCRNFKGPKKTTFTSWR